MILFNGSSFTDERGTVRFVNTFDLKKVVRMYCIEPNTSMIRAWQGHKHETKWFYVAKGRFLVKTIQMENLKNITQIILSDQESKVLEIPGGYFNGFQALEKGSVIMVFSDFTLDESKNDDFRLGLEEIQWQ
jgi:dTDP-4-dehydrorhamnose 3,5-epimerase